MRARFDQYTTQYGPYGAAKIGQIEVLVLLRKVERFLSEHKCFLSEDDCFSSEDEHL